MGAIDWTPTWSRVGVTVVMSSSCLLPLLLPGKGRELLGRRRGRQTAALGVGEPREPLELRFLTGTWLFALEWLLVHPHC